MTAGVAILVFSVFFVLTCAWLAAKVDPYFALSYAALYIYTIATQYGYNFRPDLSLEIGAYFGSAVFWDYYRLIFLSFALLFLLFATAGKLVVAKRLYHIVTLRRAAAPVALVLATVIHWGGVAVVTMLIIERISYETISADESAQDLLMVLLGIGFKMMVPSLLLWWFLLRERFVGAWGWVALILGSVLFGSLCIRLGNRTDLLAISLGLMFYEYYRAYQARRVWSRVTAFIVGISLLVGAGAYIEEVRSGGKISRDLEDRLILNDYYAPSHMLLAAMDEKYVAPHEVLRSNYYNALVLQGYPYLQTSITELFRPEVEVATRARGYAFYIFTEGYLFAGELGYVYNAVVVFLGILLWRGTGLSTNEKFNRFVLMLIASMVINMVRGQSSYFIKYYYTYFIPWIALLFLVTGMRPALMRRPAGNVVVPSASGGELHDTRHS